MAATPAVVGVGEAVVLETKSGDWVAVFVGVHVARRRDLGIGHAERGQVLQEMIERPVLEHQHDDVIDRDLIAKRRPLAERLAALIARGERARGPRRQRFALG